MGLPSSRTTDPEEPLARRRLPLPRREVDVVGQRQQQRRTRVDADEHLHQVRPQDQVQQESQNEPDHERHPDDDDGVDHIGQDADPEAGIPKVGIGAGRPCGPVSRPSSKSALERGDAGDRRPLARPDARHRGIGADLALRDHRLEDTAFEWTERRCFTLDVPIGVERIGAGTCLGERARHRYPQPSDHSLSLRRSLWVETERRSFISTQEALLQTCTNASHPDRRPTRISRTAEHVIVQRQFAPARPCRPGPPFGLHARLCTRGSWRSGARPLYACDCACLRSEAFLRSWTDEVCRGGSTPQRFFSA